MTITETLEAIERLPKGENKYPKGELVWVQGVDIRPNLTTHDLHQLAEHVRKLEESLQLGLGNIRLAEEFEIDLGRGWQQFAEQARQVVKEQQ